MFWYECRYDDEFDMACLLFTIKFIKQLHQRWSPGRDTPP